MDSLGYCADGPARAVDGGSKMLADAALGVGLSRDGVAARLDDDYVSGDGKLFAVTQTHGFYVYQCPSF